MPEGRAIALRPDDTFSGRCALVTGAGSGIGRATARIFAARGARVAVLDQNLAGAEETVALVAADPGEGSARAWHCDVSDPAAVRASVDAVTADLGPVELLVNNAGVRSDRCPLEEVTAEMFQRSMAVHVGGTLFVTQTVLPSMKTQGYGRIVNISSIQGMVGYANGATYNAAKGAVLAMSKGWAKEFAPWSIRVNIVAPGHTLTPMPLSQDSMEVVARKAEGIPLKRYAQPEEMGYAIAWLCGPESEFVTGQVLSPNGGFTIT